MKHISMWQIIKKQSKKFITVALVFAMLLGGFPSNHLTNFLARVLQDRNIVDVFYHAMHDRNVIDKGMTLLAPRVEKAHAADFQMQTGYYMGTGASQAITGVGFQPEFIIIKSNTTAGAAVFKTSAMPASHLAYMSATANNTGAQLSLDSDGFTVATLANVNTADVRYQWIAFTGSDCTASGTFCVGQYTGNGAATRTIDTGFQPDLAIVKRSTAVGANFRVTSHPANRASYFTTTADNTAGGLIASFAANGFVVGSAVNNVNGGVYNYVVFKESASVFKQGTYTGNAVDNRNITGVGFRPDFIFVKNSTSATTASRSPAMSQNESYGDHATAMGETTASTVNIIQGLQTDGFEIGSAPRVNESGATLYYAAFGGAPAYSGASGTFTMDSGSYTGTGAGFSVTGLSFAPDLVIIKDNAANHGVFRTRLMSGNITAYLGAGATDFTGGVTSLNNDGFSIGTSTVVNTVSNTYHWQAFGNAWNPYTNSGAEDFAIGVYTGNAIDNRNITRLPWQPNLVAAKRNNTTVGVFRLSETAGDSTSGFSSLAETANFIQALNTDGFQIGTNAVTNTSGSLYRWFAFKTGNNFNVGTYTGNNSDNRNITNVGFQPDLLWIKRSTTVNAVQRTSSLSGDTTQYFVNLANVSDRIQTFINNGFQIGGNQAETNASGGTYRWAAWQGKRYTQQAYRFFGNTDTTDVGTPLSTQNTPPTLSTSGQEFRLRLLARVDNGNLYPSGQSFKLQYVDPGSGTCASPTGGTPASYTDVTGATLIAYNDNLTPSDGDSLISNANDPIDGARAIVNQTYEESNNFSNTFGDILNGQTGKWDFSLVDNGATPGATFCFRMVLPSGTSLNTYAEYPSLTTAISGGTLTADIVDSGGTPVVSPSVAMSSVSFSFTNQTSTGSFGTSGQKIRVDNGTGTAVWTLSLAADSGTTAFWDGTSADYDFNDPTPNAEDGADTDSFGGQMTIDPSSATITPEGGCTLTNISSGALTSFSEGVTDSITIASAASGADTNCYWDITGIDISQTIPAEQPAGSYSLDMTLSIIAS